MIAHNKPTLGQEEIQAAGKVINSGWLAQGKVVEEFENLFCDFIGLPSEHAIAVSSGTSALYMALWALNAKNQSVAFPSYVCSAVRNAVAMADAKEMIIDIENQSPNISIDALNKSGCHIAIAPHMFGVPIDINQIQSKFIIEDCCQALGAKINGKQVGLHGDLGVFSFYATKLITSGGQGGMIVSKNKHLIDEIKDFRAFDMRADNKTRFNFQMTDLQASIGVEQLKKLPFFLERRREIYNMYVNAGLPVVSHSNLEQHLTPIHFRALYKTNQPTDIINKLADNGVKAIIPIEDWELLAQTSNAVKYCTEYVSLPIYPGLTNNEINHIIHTLKK